MPDYSPRKTALLARRAELLGEMSEIDATLDETPPPDTDDRATERQGDEVLEALGRHDQLELRRIDAALDRLEDGSYGTCLKCGSEISEERLATLPDTPFCRRCAT